jgi:hypothetical protein
MNCQECEEAIALYAGGDLDGRWCLEVERHLAGCAGCQSFASGMAVWLEEARAAHHEDIAPAHFAAVRARVLEKLRPVPWWRRRWLQVATIAAVAFGVAVEMTVQSIRRPVPPPQVALAHPPAPLLAMPARAVPPRGVPPKPVRRSLPRKLAPAEEPLVVRIVTDNPEVVIYWIANPKGEIE